MAETLSVAKSKLLSTSSGYVTTLSGSNQSSYTLQRMYSGYPIQTAFLGFAAPAAANKYKRLLSVKVNLRLRPQAGYSAYNVNVSSNERAFNANDTSAAGTGKSLGTYTQQQLPVGSWTTITVPISSADLVNVIRYGVHITAYSTPEAGNVQTFKCDLDASSCSITADYYSYDVSATWANAYPEANSRVDRTKDITVSANINTVEPSYEPLKATGYTLKLKPSGGSDTVIASETYSTPSTYVGAIIPANTITAKGTYTYTLTVTLNNGTTKTNIVSIKAEDAVPQAPTNLQPNGTFEDGSQQITFSWQHNIETGTDPYMSALYYTLNGVDFTLLEYAPGPATEIKLKITADKLVNGQLFWAVKTYNADGASGTAGTLSETAKFTVIAAPDAPTITKVTAAPKLAIEWNAVEQYAYEIIVDGKVVKREFGSAKKWESDELYPNGSHEIKVSVQGGTSLWSAYAVKNVDIANAPYGSINLTVTAGDFADLRWTSNYAHDEYWIYRDGNRIGKTTGATYTDEYAAGRSSYEVRGVKRPATNYTPSNTVTIDVKCCTMIKNINAAEWLPLILSDTVHRTEQISKGRNVNVVHMAGRKYPEAQLSEHYSESIQVTCALDNVESKRILEALAGEIVVIKTNKGRTCTGIMTDLAISDGQMYTVYQFTVVRLNGVLEYE